MKFRRMNPRSRSHARIETMEPRTLFSGELDPSFGTAGVASAPAAGTLDQTVNSIVQPDGKLLVQTWQAYGSGGTNEGQLGLTRFNANGQLDLTFGTNGSVSYDYHVTPTTVVGTDDWDHDNRLLVQGDGKIISVRTAEFTSAAGVSEVRILVMRLNADGSIDSTFNSAPALNFTFGKLTGEQDWVTGAALQGDGKILVLANSTNGSHANAGVLRLNPDGSIDKTYGSGGGSLKLGVGSIEMDATIDSFGRLVVGYDVGHTGLYATDQEPVQFGVYRLTTRGSIDPTFNGGHVAFSPKGSGIMTTVGNLVIDSTGDILIDAGAVSGSSNTGAFMAYGVARFTPFGKPDTSFGKGGLAMGTPQSVDDPTNPADYARIYGLAVQSDDKPLILSFGTYFLSFSSEKQAVITRLTSTGAVDSSFGTAGFTYVPGDPISIQFQSTAAGGYIYAGFTSADESVPQAGRWFADVTDPSPAPLGGLVIGTAGSFKNDGETIANVFDHDVDSFFDAPTASGAWVGLDLGSAQLVKQIRYVPRTGYASRMVGGQFQASNSADFSTGVVTLATIKTAPPAGARTIINLTGVIAYRYVRYIGPAGGYCNIAALNFLG